MAWKGKGRSGIGDTNIQGTWDDWDGLSPNGRQYKNTITQETRNLSGADYWHARKANSESQQPPIWLNGRANVSAFTDDNPDRQAKPKPGESVISWQDPLDAIQKPKGYKVRPGELYLERLDVLELSLFKQYKSGMIKEMEWQAERQAITSRRQREWVIFENSGFAPVDTQE